MSSSRNFRVLDATQPDERALWEAIWSSWPSREVFAHPAYVELFLHNRDRAVCLAQANPRGGVLLPLIQRHVADEPWAEPDSDFTDLVSPYGYGGAFFWGDAAPAEFWAAVESWAKSSRAVSCFMRLSVLGGQVLDPPGVVETRSLNVVRDLTPSAESMWMEFDHKVRKNVKRAQRAGLTVVVDPAGTRVEEFRRIYAETMDRRSASAGYYFPAAFFDRLIARLGGQYCFFHCCRGNDVVSTELVLVSECAIYSFLGGTLAEAFSDRPNDFLKHHVIQWGKEHGKSDFVLGGGYEKDDGIFKYKQAFAPSGAVPFRTGIWTIDVDAYNTLCERRREWEREHACRDWQPGPGYFPKYRA